MVQQAFSLRAAFSFLLLAATLAASSTGQRTPLCPPSRTPLPKRSRFIVFWSVSSGCRPSLLERKLKKPTEARLSLPVCCSSVCFACSRAEKDIVAVLCGLHRETLPTSRSHIPPAEAEPQRPLASCFHICGNKVCLWRRSNPVLQRLQAGSHS